MKKLKVKAKVKSIPSERVNRPKPQSFRFSELTIKQLNALAKVTGKKKTVILEELVESAHTETVKK